MAKKNTIKKMMKKLFYILIGTYIIFAFFITGLVLFDIVAYGKVDLQPIDYIIVGCISILYFIYILVKAIRENKRELIHRKGESWKE